MQPKKSTPILYQGSLRPLYSDAALYAVTIIHYWYRYALNIFGFIAYAFLYTYNISHPYIRIINAYTYHQTLYSLHVSSYIRQRRKSTTNTVPHHTNDSNPTHHSTNIHAEPKCPNIRCRIETKFAHYNIRQKCPRYTCTIICVRFPHKTVQKRTPPKQEKIHQLSRKCSRADNQINLAEYTSERRRKKLQFSIYFFSGVCPEVISSVKILLGKFELVKKDKKKPPILI